MPKIIPEIQMPRSVTTKMTNVERIEPLLTRENLAAHGVTIPPEVQQNPDLMRKTMLKFGPRLQQAQQTQQTEQGRMAGQFLTGQVPGFTPGP